MLMAKADAFGGVTEARELAYLRVIVAHQSKRPIGQPTGSTLVKLASYAARSVNSGL